MLYAINLIMWLGGLSMLGFATYLYYFIETTREVRPLVSGGIILCIFAFVVTSKLISKDSTDANSKDSGDT